jgi:site-specific DNA-cytosine methylase
MPPADSKFRKAEDLDSLRYYALGNAVTVPVAEWLARQVKEYLARRRFVDSVKEILSTEAP